MEKFFKNKNLLKSCLVLILFVIVSLFLYYPTMRSFPLWDDWYYIFRSWTLQNTAPYKFWLWGEYRRSWPLFYTIISWMYKSWGWHFFNYHLTSVLIHSVNAFLIYRILKRIGGANSLLVALLYLVHPLNFFTVAWIFQLKTLLSIFFFLISFELFFKSEEVHSSSKYWLSVVFFACSLFSKAVFVPVAIFMLFYKNKSKAIPFILLCIYSFFITFWPTHLKDYFNFKESSPQESQINHSVPFTKTYAGLTNKDIIPLSRPIIEKTKKMELPFQNVAVALKNFTRYSILLLYPKDILLVTPTTIVEYSYREIILSSIVVSIFILLFFIFKRQRNTFSTLGLSFFLISIIPLCGLIYAPIFFYSTFVIYWLSVPVLGLLICLSFSKFKYTKIILIFLVLVFSFRTFQVSRKTPKTIEMINASIEKSPKNYLVKLILATHYEFVRDFSKANKILMNVKKSSDLEMKDIIKMDERMDKNVRGMNGEVIDDFTL